MRRPFVRRGDEIEVRLTDAERELLATLPELLAGVGAADGDPAAERLAYVAHPDDPELDAAYAEVVGDDLDALRRRDREELMRDLEAATLLDQERADVWLRVMDEARLTLATRLGIEEEWEPIKHILNPQGRAYLRLSYLQDALVGALLAGDEAG